MKKQKELEIKTMYLGDIKKCLSLTKFRIHIVDYKKKVCLIEFNNGKFITYENYVEGKYQFLEDRFSYEEELFVDRNSLEELDYVETTGVISEVNEKSIQKRLHFFGFRV